MDRPDDIDSLLQDIPYILGSMNEMILTGRTANFLCNIYKLLAYIKQLEAKHTSPKGQHG